jgi:hypothetical protein
MPPVMPVPATPEAPGMGKMLQGLRVDPVVELLAALEGVRGHWAEMAESVRRREVETGQRAVQ